MHPTTSQTTIVELQDVSKRFGSTLALDNVSVAVRPGEVHAIVGENGAGKSTLIHVLAGELQPDHGILLFDSEPARFGSPVDSQRMGISVVYQELALCPNLTVAENVSLNVMAHRSGWRPVNRREQSRLADRALAKLGLEDLELDRPVRSLGVAKQQLVEIAKAIATDVRVLVLDEPNSALTDEESQHLFTVVRQLRDEGIAIVYVSHRLDEVLDLSDRITVMRDGRVIETMDAGEATAPLLIQKMVGREIDKILGNKMGTTVSESEALHVRNLSDPSVLSGIELDLRKGEIVGVAGLPGAGKEELVDCLFGLRPHTGEIELGGQFVRILSPADAIRYGMVLVPADRRGSGAMLVMSIRENVAAASLDKVSRRGFLRRGAMEDLAATYMARLDVRASGTSQKMGTLSGGNQQKVILARSLATDPKVLVLHEPTRGIDVGAKAEIYTILQRLAADGVAILIVSSEMPELIGQCDRLLVLHQGSVTGRLLRDDFDEERILACAMGHARFDSKEA